MLLAHLIQAGYYGHPSGFFYGMSAGTMGSWILIIVIGIVGWIVQARLQSVFAKYARVPFPGGLTGAEVAEKMLRDNGIRNVKVTHVAGHLTDHFNPQTMTVNLSDSVYASRSVAAAAVAAHECGHAVQHARGYAPLELRSQLVPIVNFSARAEVHHRASLRSAIFSIPTQWTLALHTMGTEIVVALRIKRAIGIQLPTRIALFILVRKSYAYLPKHLRTRMIGRLLS